MLPSWRLLAWPLLLSTQACCVRRRSELDHGRASYGAVADKRVARRPLFELDASDTPSFYHATTIESACSILTKNIDPKTGNGKNGVGFYMTPRVTDYIKDMGARNLAKSKTQDKIYILKVQDPSFWGKEADYRDGFAEGSEKVGVDYVATRWDTDTSGNCRMDRQVEIQTLGFGTTPPGLPCREYIETTNPCGLAHPTNHYDRLVSTGEIISRPRPDKSIAMEPTRKGRARPTRVLRDTGPCQHVAKYSNKEDPLSPQRLKNDARIESFLRLMDFAKKNVTVDSASTTHCRVLDDFASESSWRSAYLSTIEEVTYKTSVAVADLTIVQILEVNRTQSSADKTRYAENDELALASGRVELEQWVEATCEK